MSLATWIAEFYPIPAKAVPEAGAVAHSLQKWKGLTPENLKAHEVKLARFLGRVFVMPRDLFVRHPNDLPETAVPIDSDSCALCARFFHKNRQYCELCPLAKSLGDRCDSLPDSPWVLFLDALDPTVMIQALERVDNVFPHVGRGVLSEAG